MALDSGFHIPGEVRIDGGGGVFGQQGNALEDGSARRARYAKDSRRRGAAFDDDLSTGANAGQQPSKVTGCFRFRDVNRRHGDHDTSHASQSSHFVAGRLRRRDDRVLQPRRNQRPEPGAGGGVCAGTGAEPGAGGVV